MKRRRALAPVAIFAVVLALCGCASKGASVVDPRLGGTWHLVAGNDRGSAISLGGDDIYINIGDVAHTGGLAPCSLYSATVVGGPGAVYVTASLMTPGANDCTDYQRDTVDDQYADALNAARFATVDRGTLVLASQKATLVFVRNAAKPVKRPTNTTWRLYSNPLTGPLVSLGTDTPLLHFDGSGQVSISSRCVVVRATGFGDDDNLSISHFETTSLDLDGCTRADRTPVLGAANVLTGALLVSESHSSGAPTTLVVTNLDSGIPVIWRATS